MAFPNRESPWRGRRMPSPEERNALLADHERKMEARQQMKEHVRELDEQHARDVERVQSVVKKLDQSTVPSTTTA